MSKQGGFMSKFFKRKNKNTAAEDEPQNAAVTKPSPRLHGNGHQAAAVVNNNEIKEEKEVKITILRSISSEAEQRHKTELKNESAPQTTETKTDPSKEVISVEKTDVTKTQQRAEKEKIVPEFPRTRYSYPEKMSQFIHRTHCYIPAPLAAVLDTSPDLVAPMVQAFYYRDPLDLKACVTFSHFRPGTRVLRQVKMTKCLYAQLMQQQFTADRRSGYTLPPSDDPSHKSHDVGIKLAHGAEILCSKCGSGATFEDGMSHDAKWQAFLASLAQKGYFKGEIEGSQLYNKLLDDAKKFFQTSASLQAGDETSPGHKILQILKTAHYDVEQMRKEEKNLDPADDDTWLSVSPEQLDDMLNRAYQDAFQNSSTTDLNHVTNSMKAFVNKISSHEGAEFPGAEEDDDVTFDPDGFIQTMHKMFDFKDEAIMSSDDDMSEYASDDDLDYDVKSKPATSHNADFMDLEDMKVYMEQMDRELAHTEIAKSFVTKQSNQNPVAPPRNKKKKKQESKSAKSAASNQNTQTHKTPNKPNIAPKPTKSDDFSQKAPNKAKVAPKATLADDFSDIDDLDEDFEPVNVDLNLVKNLLESHSAQQGLAGPSSNILASMDIKLPQDSGETD